jgi:CheY-like chemotaxis protein
MDDLPLSSPSVSPIPESFQAHVREALEHLLDAAFLQQVSQNFDLEILAGSEKEGVGVKLKRQLLEAIEALNPGGGVYFRAPQARPYHMLLLHYVERQTIQKAAHELGISERQAYRDLRAGELSVAAYIWDRRQARSNQPARQPAGKDSAPAEAASPASLLDLCALLRTAAGAVERLARQQQVQVEVCLAEPTLTVFTDAVVARQVLTSLLSRAVQQAQGNLTLDLAAENQDTVSVKMTFTPRRLEDRALLLDALVNGFLQQLGWEAGETSAPEVRLHLKIPRKHILLLVIDDEEAFGSLVKRYLSGLPVRVAHALGAEQGLQLATSLRPAAILLDVMMPGMDGWEMLQNLRTRPETMNCPVIVCSVFDDPELARSLGASGTLPKPLSQEALFSALTQLGVIHATI